MSKLHRSTGSIGFINKVLFNEVKPKLAQVRGNFINNNDKYKSKRILLLLLLKDHDVRLKTIVITQYQLIDKLKHLTGRFLYSLIVNHVDTYNTTNK